tara:strand:- start:51 stop:1085 length:1035 start_codon:yes stop_codon:yes gene_type:complete
MKPLLITGVYRSGTTLVSDILRKHPDLDITYDSINYFRFIIKKNISSENYKEIVNSISHRMKDRYSISLDSKKIINRIEQYPTEINHANIYSFIMHDLFNYSNKRWGEKSVLEWTSIPKFLDMYDDSQVIHIIRDPRDVLASRKFMTIAPGKQYLDTIFNCMHSMQHALHYIDSLPKNRYLLIQYEELILQKKEVAQKIFNFLDEKFYDNLILNENLTDNKGDILSINTHSSYSDSNLNNLTGRWREKLDDEDIILTQFLLKKYMKKFEYKIESKFISKNTQVLAEKIFNSDNLLKKRWENFKKTGEGVEDFTNDPTDPKNWVKRSGIEGQGAGKGYKKFKSET